MKTFEIQEFGIDNLTLTDREVPQPGAGQVLVRMTAASLNFRDLMVAKGVYNPKLKRPMIPLSDGVGRVEAIGPDVTRFRKDDRVAGCFMQKWIEGPINRDKFASALGGSMDGVLSEYNIFSEEGLVAVPPSLTDEQGAALPCAGVTAWHALFEHSRPVPGDTVLLQGTGGVSVFALQLAKTAGLRVIITSSSDEKLERARSMGADEVVNYKRTENWEGEARKLTGGSAVDHVVEVGGADTLPRSLKAVRMGGAVSVIGALSGAAPTVEPRGILMNSLRVQGIYVGSREMFERLNRAVEFHAIKPVVDKVFAWTEFPDAWPNMEGRQHFGKICLRF